MNTQIPTDHPFQVSDKIVCIDDHIAPENRLWLSSFPKHGQTYVVRETYFNDAGRPAVNLVGISGARPLQIAHEIGFCAGRFRLLADVRDEAEAMERAVA
jgi:hypothetical protein